METLEILVSQIFDNRDSYKDIDFITIMNMLKESYNTIKGNPLTSNDDKGVALYDDDGSGSEMDSDAEVDMIHSWYDDSDGDDVADDDFWNYNGR